ncbi:MAG: hypothetical protein FWG98_14000 [Candidatus Cloacimonetes bacterium]|nr:hypothetical protein [Candidatus Cloacimonadota bacterium]
MKRINKYSILAVLLISLIIFLISALGCSESNPTKPEINLENPAPTGKFVQGEIRISTRYYECIEDILDSYSEYGLSIESGWLSSSFVLSFNYNQTDGNDLVTILEEDPRIDWANLAQGWIHGELIVGLSSSTNDKTINDFIRSYSRYGLKIVTSARSINYFRLSFNPSLVDEFDFRYIMHDDPLVNWVDFNGPLRIWVSGEFFVSLHDNDYHSFIESYSIYTVKLKTYNEFTNSLLIEFDHTEINEFLLYEMIKSDSRVERISHHHIAFPTRGLL